MFSKEMIGRRIRHLRLERGMTQEALAGAAGLTTGYVSKIENSHSQAPVTTLVRISLALGVEIGDIFADQEIATGFVVVRGSERQSLRHKGASYEPLAFQFPNRHMEPFILRIPSEAGAIEERDRPGEGFLLMLEGRVRVRMDGFTDELGEGDSAYFTLSVPHSIESIGGEAVVLSVTWLSRDTEMGRNER